MSMRRASHPTHRSPEDCNTRQVNKWLETFTAPRQPESPPPTAPPPPPPPSPHVATSPSPQKVGSKETGVLALWRRRELRCRTLVSWIVWAAFGFLYYGVILLSADVLGESDTCSFDYSILFFAASSELVSNLMSRTYIDVVDRRHSLTANFLLSGMATVFLPFNENMAWLLLLSFVARGASYTAACFAWTIT